MNPKSFVAIAARPFLICVALWCLFAGGTASAQTTVKADIVVDHYVDIPVDLDTWTINPTNELGMYRVGSPTGYATYWTGTYFNTSDGVNRDNKIRPGEYLRVGGGGTTVGSVYSFTATSLSKGALVIEITIKASESQITALNRLDPASTASGLVRWEAVFSAAVTGLSADNFTLINSAGISPLPAIVSVLPTPGALNKKYIITVQIAGYGRGTLALRYLGYIAEKPAVWNPLTGDNYNVDTLVFGIAPGGSVDLLAPENWWFDSDPSPSGATMARVSSNLVTVNDWGASFDFKADPGNRYNRIYSSGEFLRISAGSVQSGGQITVNIRRSNPGSSIPAYVNVVTPSAQVVSMNIIDPSPTVAQTVRWEVTFNKAITNVSTANFGFVNSANITPPPSVISVTPSPGGNNVKWIVTAGTPGKGTGLLSLRWTGHVSESPSVPYAFVGLTYDFSFYPIIIQDLVTTPYFVAPGAAMPTFSPVFSVRSNDALQYHWRRGSSQYPDAATGLSAFNASYTPPVTTTQGTYNYFCRAYIGSTETGYYCDSGTATVNVVSPPAITAQPANSNVILNSAVTLSVQATGYSPQYQWYRGASGDKSNPISGATSANYAASPTVNSPYWVLVSNALGSAYDVASNTAIVTVIKQLTATSPTTVTPTILDNVGGLTVRADDSSNNPVSGIPVTFTISLAGVVGGANAGGSFSGLTYSGGTISVTLNTGSDGTAVAPVFWTNTRAGTYNVIAAFGTLTRSFTIINQPLPFSTFTIITNVPSAATAGTAFSSQPVLQMTDSWSNSISSNAAVTVALDFFPTGTLQGTTTVNAVNGLATFTDLKHLVAEKISLQAQSGTVKKNLGDIQVSPAAPQKIAVYSGSPQVALPGATFGLPLTALLTDAYDNPISTKTNLTFIAPTIGASATFGSGVNKADTDNKGRAKVQAIANTVNGTYVVKATVTDGSIASFASFALSNLSTVQAWRSDNFNGNWDNTGNAADTATPFGDGVPNLAKYAFNLNARGPDRTQMVPTGFNGLPYTGMDSSKHLTLTFVRRRSSTTPGITYTPQFSNSPSSSSFAVNASATTGAPVTIDNTWERVTVTDSVTVGAGQPVRYGRVLVSEP